MFSRLNFLLVISCYVSHVTGGGSWCDDLDTVACLALKQQSPDFCADENLRTQICPSLCNNCPLQCYSCTIDEVSDDLSQCNRISCSGKDERCAYWFQSSTGIERLTCADVNTACGISSSEFDVKCCNTDLCNGNLTKISSSHTPSTKPSSTQLPTTTITTTAETTLIKMSSPTTQVQATSLQSVISKPGVCKKDVIFMLGDTYAELPFQKMKTFVKQVIGSLDISNELNHVSITTFHQHHHSNTVLALNRGTNLHTCQTVVDRLTHTRNFGTSNFAAVRHLLNCNQFENRHDVEDAVVIISNGNLMDFMQPGSLNRLHQMYPNVIVIAYGNANVGQLHNIASSPNHFMHHTWGIYDSVLLQWLIQQICS